MAAILDTSILRLHNQQRIKSRIRNEFLFRSLNNS
jgi:hypothetical protein